MKDNCVIICSSICNGYFHDERWPYLRELYEMFQHDYMNILPDMDRYGEYFATNQEYIRKYRFCNAFHPFHGFSMMSCGHIAEMNTAAIYIVGAQEPGIARGMGLKTRATFEEALEDAKKKFVGPNPNILALPKTFKLGAVHLCMKDATTLPRCKGGAIHMLKGNMLIAHGGGPTPVINSSLLGAVREAKRHGEIETIYGARFGAEGILAGDLMDLGAFDDGQLDLLSPHPRLRPGLLPAEAHRR